jgi:hypothetical protein
MKTTIKLFISFYVILGIILIPFSFHLIHFHTEAIRWLFGKSIFLFAQKLGLHPQLNDLSSDSIGLYILVVILIFLSIILSFITRNILNQQRQEQLLQFAVNLAAFYLSLILFKYGFDKLFKVQFNQPEPNLLYTPMGHLDKDILFWSTMGSSRAYNMFMGSMEVIPAILLLFRRTRIFGAFIAIGVMLNVVAINFTFDISVKLFSCFLLFLALVVSWKGLKQIFELFILRKEVKPEISSTIPSLKKQDKWIKTFFVSLLLLEALFPYLKNGVFNDDNAPRPFLHGAYQVSSDQNTDLKRVFIHRDGYLILQTKDDQLSDFKLVIKPIKNHMIIRDYHGKTNMIYYSLQDDLLTLSLPHKPNDKITFQKLDHLNLPLLQHQFHWTVD